MSPAIDAIRDDVERAGRSLSAFYSDSQDDVALQCVHDAVESLMRAVVNLTNLVEDEQKRNSVARGKVAWMEYAR